MQNQGHIVGSERRSKVVRSCKPTSYDLPLDLTIYPWVSEDACFLDEKRFFVVILFCSCRRFGQYGETFTIVISTAYQDAGTSWVRNFSLNSLFNLMCGSHIVNLTCHLSQYSNVDQYKKKKTGMENRQS